MMGRKQVNSLYKGCHFFGFASTGSDIENSSTNTNLELP